MTEIRGNKEKFPIKIDDLCEDLQITRHRDLIRKITTKFKENIDFIKYKKKSTGGRPKIGMLITQECCDTVFCISLNSKRNLDNYQYKTTSVKVLKHIPCKEHLTIGFISKALRVFQPKSQFWIFKYKIDLYFPVQRLAVECDEFGHKDRDIGNELERQKNIENELNCTFIRFNPDSQGFLIENIINKILEFLIKNYTNI
tara:strand:- start:2722 stop:3321 length:600 start_codon:yes stop_codon:yes gene_type:complete